LANKYSNTELKEWSEKSSKYFLSQRWPLANLHDKKYTTLKHKLVVIFGDCAEVMQLHEAEFHRNMSDYSPLLF
jgi:hypothetical protein